MMQWWERLQAWMDQEGWSVSDLSARSGVPEDSLYKYLKGRTRSPRGNVLDQISRPFGRSAAELQYGVEEPAMLATRRIPLLTANECGTLRNIKGELIGWRGRVVIVPNVDLSPDAFAVDIPDGANLPKIEQGDIVIVDPEAPIFPGAYVIAVVSSMGIGVCRKYRPQHAVDKSAFSLIATNEDFPAIHITPENPGFVLGRAVKVIKSL